MWNISVFQHANTNHLSFCMTNVMQTKTCTRGGLWRYSHQIPPVHEGFFQLLSFEAENSTGKAKSLKPNGRGKFIMIPFPTSRWLWRTFLKRTTGALAQKNCLIRSLDPFNILTRYRLSEFSSLASGRKVVIIQIRPANYPIDPYSL